MSGYVELLPPDAPRAQWLAVRQTGIGSSDIAAILGQSGWATPYSVWWDKVGPVNEDNDGKNESMRWGQLLEPIVADEWTLRTGIETTRIGVCRNSDRPWQMATPDRLTADGGLLECKTASSWLEDEWAGESVPIKYLLQTTWQMDTLGVDHGYMAVLIGGQEMRIFDVPLDLEIVAVIRERGAAFWRLVEAGTAPPTDGLDPTTEALKVRWSEPEPDKIVVLDSEWLDQLDWREQHKADIAEATQASKAIDNALREACGNATHAVCNGLLVATWKPRKDGVRVVNIVASDKRKEMAL